MVLQQELDVQQEQISLLERKCDDLNLAKSNWSQNISALKTDYTCQIRDLTRQLDDNMSAKHDMQQVLAHLRDEVS